MQETHILYTAKDQEDGIHWLRVPRWVDVLTFLGMLLAFGIVLGGSVASGDPRALVFVKTALWVMYITLGVFGLMLLVDWIGLWGLLGLVPLALWGILWLAGVSGQTLFQRLGQEMIGGVVQMLRLGFYGFAGIAGLGLLARLIEKVGIVGFLATIAVAIGISIWLIG